MSTKTYLVNGKARWCKILGDAPPGYDNGPNEWSFDLLIDEKGKSDYLASGGDKFYVRTDKKTGEEYIKFVRKAIKQDGTPAQNIRVVDYSGNDWDQSVLIGNGSILNVQFSLNEVKSKGQKRMKPSALAVQVWSHEKYKPKSPFPVKESDEVVLEGTEGQEW